MSGQISKSIQEAIGDIVCSALHYRERNKVNHFWLVSRRLGFYTGFNRKDGNSSAISEEKTAPMG